MMIRSEKPEELAEIYNLIERAFRAAKVTDGDEQNFADRLRAGKGYVPRLALVAEEGGKLAGQVMLTRFTVRTEGGNEEILLVAPLSVTPEYRFGFRPSVECGIRNTDGIPECYVLALEPVPGALKAMNGTVTFAGM